ncbi:DUF4397 domain-containing protein [Pedobacter steynii]|uniref:DUF4397 domain-containing protein n=1 Tax=Pedobacter steynii TaxID=430522 RepID=A0A1D7QKE1_9SPHI|nr:DUF4397 domain-containing protein [Pedobacter steynii]AOM79144.1 hypothetical protein BFS30_19395 [Pedobacter steynii]
MELFTKNKPLNLFRLMTASLFGLSTLMLASCSTKETPVPESSSLMVVNTSASPGTYNVYINGGKANPGPLPFGGPLPYIRLNTGESTIKFTTAGSTESLVTKKIILEDKKGYSLFLIDKEPKLDILIASDEVSALPTTKALIRFINLSPDAPALDLAVKDGAALVTGKAYKAIGDFIEIEPKKYIFQIKDKTASPLKAELAETEIKAGGIYTVLSIGLVNPTGMDPRIMVKLITNK